LALLQNSWVSWKIFLLIRKIFIYSFSSLSMLKALCYICGEVASHTCKLCGRPVCEKHYIPSLGVCINCAKGRKLKFE
jgi:hypothetical protein